MSSGKKRTRGYIVETGTAPAVAQSPASASTERTPKTRKLIASRGKTVMNPSSTPSSPATNSPPLTVSTPVAPAVSTPLAAESKPSSSPVPSSSNATASSSSGEFADPKDKVRGYIATFNWKQHYPFGEVGPSIMQETPLVPSIPALFYHVITAIQQVEREVKGREVLLDIDRKIARPVEKGAERKATTPFLLSSDGTDYLINACRKEHVKLFFEGTDGGLLTRLGLCPRLVEVYSVSPGTRDLKSNPVVAGYSVDSSIPCNCSVAVVSKPRPKAGVPAAPPTPSVASSAEDGDAELDNGADADDSKDDDVKALGTTSTASSRKPNDKPKSSKGREPFEDAAGAGMDMDSSDDEEKPDRNEKDVDDFTVGDHWTDLEKSIALARKNVEKLWRVKMREVERERDALKAQLADSERRLGDAEQRWRDEKDVNHKLWEKLDSINKTVDRMVKPLKKDK